LEVGGNTVLGSGVDFFVEWDMTDDRLDYLFG